MTPLINRLRRHRYFLAAFTPMFAVFFYPLLTFRYSLLKGDYAHQYAPMLWAYAEALKRGVLLLWTPLIACGYPLFAEGQTAMLYLPNLILFKALPFNIAYNLGILGHYALGGIAMYALALRQKMSPAAAAMVAVAFTFGSASAGGFSGIVTLRALAWFPVLLYLVDVFVEARRALPLFLLAFVLGQSWLTGYAQIVAYECGFLILYYALRCAATAKVSRPGAAQHLFFAAAMGVSVLMGLPQLWATSELSAVSTRTLYDAGFALWGSAAPWSLSALVMYSWNAILRTNFYIGVPLLVWILLCPFGRQKKIWWILAAVSFAMALGAFNPFYLLMLKIPLVSLLRRPSKFLFFTAFFLTILGGLAFDDFIKLSKEAAGDTLRRVRRRLALAFGLLALLAFGAWSLVRLAEPVMLWFGKWYVGHFVIGKSFHKWSADHYLSAIGPYAAFLKSEISFGNVFFWTPIAAFLCVWALAVSALSKKIRNPTLVFAAVALLCADLFVYGRLAPGTSFVGNIAAFENADTRRDLPRDGRWLDPLPESQALFAPNRNLSDGHAIIGAYTPLIIKDYYLLTKDLGVVDDSLGRLPFSRQALTDRRDLLDFLGAKYFVFDAQTVPQDTTVFETASGKTIYLNPHGKTEFSFAADSQTDADETVGVPSPESFKRLRPADISERADDFISVRLTVRCPAPGVLVRNQVFDKGWKAFVDGAPATLIKRLGAFQGVPLPAGAHRVELRFAPDYFTKGMTPALIAFLLCAAGIAGCLLSQGNQRLRDGLGALWILSILWLYLAWVILPKSFSALLR